jgi:hypothetical protein
MVTNGIIAIDQQVPQGQHLRTAVMLMTQYRQTFVGVNGFEWSPDPFLWYPVQVG